MESHRLPHLYVRAQCADALAIYRLSTQSEHLERRVDIIHLCTSKTQHFSLQLTGFFSHMDQGGAWGGRSGHTVSKYSVIPRSYCWGLNFPEVREKWAEICDCQVDSCGEDPKRELASRDARSGEQQPRSSRYRERKRGGTSSCAYQARRAWVWFGLWSRYPDLNEGGEAVRTRPVISS